MNKQTATRVNLPKAAVVICNHNYGAYLADAIKSAVMQDYPAKLIYIVDDCSTDNSVEIINELLGAGSPITDNKDFALEVFNTKPTRVDPVSVLLFRLKKNGGPSRARNFAIGHALENNFDIIAILDADDIWKQGRLSKAIQEIIAAPEMIGGVYTDYLSLNTETGALTYEAKWSYDLNKLRQESIVHSGAIYNAVALRAVGLYNESLRTCEDFELNRRIAQRFIFIHIAEDLCVVRVQPQNSTLTVPKETWEANYRQAVSIQI